MGPFPHDAPPVTISKANPAGTDGFEFVEFAHPEPAHLEQLFTQMGYTEVARHRTKDVSLYRQGTINYVLNRGPAPTPPVSWPSTAPALRPWPGASSMPGIP
jgi:4-hydroxyphenylpyruvate dioxygenase